jgi:putative Ca2+/H+ antiporter (TMEM165/GDT1 family)
MDIAVAATAFALIFPVELPDKTFVATLVLSTRYRPLPTWIGVSLAFGVQCLVAVTAGGLISRLPRQPVTLVAGLLFLIGGWLLWRGAARADAAEAEAEHEFEGKVRAGVSGARAVLASFLVLFVAEWGDLSQLLTAGLAVRYDDPVSVFVGSWAALLVIAGIGAVLGRAMLRRLRLSTVRRIGAAVCVLLGVLTVLAAAGVPTPF